MGSKFTLALVFVIAALSSGTANAMVNSTSQGLKADGLRLQGIAERYQQLRGSTPEGLRADGLRLQGMAQAYLNRPAASFYTPQALKADGLRWQGIANAYRVPVSVSSSSSFDWSDAGIGAVGGIGFAVFAAALILAARRVRRMKPAI